MPTPTKDPERPTEPDTNSALVREMRREIKELKTIIGDAPTHPDDTSQGSGLRGTVFRLERILGRSPDHATGDEGEGLLRVVALLNAERVATMLTKSPSTLTPAALLGASSGGGALTIALLYLIAKLFNVHLP